MILAIVGGRDFTNYMVLKEMLSTIPIEITMILSGGAKGADSLAYRYAVDKGIDFVCFPPRLEEFGSPNAFYARNNRIAQGCDAMAAFPGAKSRGTWDVIKRARLAEKKVWVYKDGKMTEVGQYV